MLVIHDNLNTNIIELYDKGFTFEVEPDHKLSSLIISVRKYNNTIRSQKSIPADQLKSLIADDGINLILSQIMKNINKKFELSSQ